MDNSPAGINVFRSARGLIEAWSFAGPLVGVVHPLLLLLWSMGFVFGYRSVSSFTKQPLSFVFGCLPSPLAAHAPVYIEILQQGMSPFYSKRTYVYPGQDYIHPISALGQNYCCAEKRMPNYLKHSFCDQQRTTRHSWSECCVVAVFYCGHQTRQATQTVP